jgi:hypothetical protein
MIVSNVTKNSVVGHSKVAGSLRGTLRAGGKIVSTFIRVGVQSRV